MDIKNSTAAEILGSELPNGKVITLLELLFDYSKDEAKAAVVGRGAKRSNGFASDFYDFLREGERTEEEAAGFIEGGDGFDETSENVKRHRLHYLAIFALVDLVRMDFAIAAEMAIAEIEAYAMEAKRAKKAA